MPQSLIRSAATRRLSGRPHNDPDGIRTRVAGVKGLCPRPLDDGADFETAKYQDQSVYLLYSAFVKGDRRCGAVLGAQRHTLIRKAKREECFEK